MADCMVTQTHRNGFPIKDRDFGPAPPAPVLLSKGYSAVIKRNVKTLCINRGRESSRPPQIIPDLHDPEIIAFGSDHAVMFRGFEDLKAATAAPTSAVSR